MKHVRWRYQRLQCVNPVVERQSRQSLCGFRHGCASFRLADADVAGSGGIAAKDEKKLQVILLLDLLLAAVGPTISTCQYAIHGRNVLYSPYSSTPKEG